MIKRQNFRGRESGTTSNFLHVPQLYPGKRCAPGGRTTLSVSSRRSKFRLALRTPISKNKLASRIPVAVIKRDSLSLFLTLMFTFPTIYVKETLHFTV